MKWTSAQERAINSRGKNLLVAAAAGSGKTAVLVNRIIKMVVEDKMDIDSFLVVTFTQAAAQEMQQRIENALAENIDTDPERLEQQLILLSGASISTLHSFCKNLLQQNFHRLNLDPEFRIGSKEELAVLKADAMEELFDEEYEQNSPVFVEMADGLDGNIKGDQKLADLIFALHDFAQNKPFPEDWLDLALRQYEPTETPVWYASLTEHIKREFDIAVGEVKDAMTMAKTYGFCNYMASIAQHDTDIRAARMKLTEDTSLDNIATTLSGLKFNLTAEKKADKNAVKTVQNLRNKYKNRINALSIDIFGNNAEESMALLRKAAPQVGELVRLTRLFAEKYQAAKKERNILDFNDLEHLTIELLMDDDSAHEVSKLVPSAAALELREKYLAVMVDEYQDTNDTQEVIINLLKSATNLFVVGDVKQSIYNFRNTNPRLFQQKYQTYPTLGEGYERIDLTENFRSRHEVLSAVNYLFVQLMNEQTMDLAYDKAAMLYPGADYPPKDNAPTLQGATEFALIYNDEENLTAKRPNRDPLMEREALYVIKRLRELMAQQTMVYDAKTGEYRPMRWRDAAVLARKNEQIVTITEVFKEQGIPAYASTDAKYFDAVEVRLMLSLLAILDNARQDIPLGAVLLSPIGGMSAKNLATLRIAVPQGDLFSALLAAVRPETKLSPRLRQKIADFLARLTRWRNAVRECSTPELIALLYRETGYYDYVGSLPGGLLRQANLRLLIDRAADYEQTNYRSLFRFLRFIDRMRDNEKTDLTVARTLGENEDVVNITTIHKSKGREYPLVFVVCLGRAIHGNKQNSLYIDNNLGIGAEVIDSQAMMHTPTLATKAIEYKKYAEEQAEELRIFYVALTRARERLILVGSEKKPKNLTAMIVHAMGNADEQNALLPAYVPVAAKSPLEWLIAALVRHRDGAPLAEFAECEHVPVDFDDYQDGSHWEIKLVPTSTIESDEQTVAKNELLATVRRREPLPSTEFKTAVENLLAWRYDRRGLNRVPAKMSVTELKRRFADIDEGAAFAFNDTKDEWKRPAFAKDGQLGAEYGTIMHSVMQHIDLDGNLTVKGIRTQMKSWLKREIFREGEIKLINPKRAADFFTSTLGKRLLKSQNAWRELPFSQKIAARRFFPEAAEDEEIFIQGVIDLLFEDENGLVLVDYKTDSVTDEPTVRERYRLQLKLYANAAEEIIGRAVGERYLYMLHDGKIIAMD